MKNSLLVFLFLLLSYSTYSQTCTLNVNLSSTGTAICSGSSIVLTASASSGTAPYTYVWSTGETTPSITVNKAGTYTITVTDKTAGCQPVNKSITITTAAIPDAPTAAGAVVCQNSSATLTATDPGGTYQWYDAATGGKFLASGATFVTPPITANSIFYVQTTLSGCTSPRTPVAVSILSKPTVVGASVCQGNVATLSASGGDSYVWYDAPSGGNIVSTTSTYTTPPLINTTIYYVVATTNGCVSTPTPVTAKVNPPPQVPVIANTAICSGSVASLHADAPAGVIDWFTVPNGGVSLISSPDYTTPPLSTTTTYYVQTTLNGCVSARAPVTVTVNPAPAVPVISNVSVCSGSSAALTPTSPGGTYLWYDFASGGTLLFTGPTFNTPPLTNTTTYYVQATNGSCGSARTPVTVSINTPPVAPSAASPIICSGNATTLTAFAPGGTYQWYDAPTGGNLLVTNASYTTPVLTATTTYYVQTTVSGCVSPRSAVTVTVLPVPVAPTATDVTVCSGSPATLTATGATGTYDWYDAPTGGNYLSSGQVFVTPALTATTIFYVQNTTSGCPSSRTPVTVTVNPVPPSPTGTGTTICPGSSANLTASVSSGTIQWYDAATAGKLLATGNTYSTPSLFGTTTYYLQNNVGSCSSARTPVTVNVTSVANPQFQYPSGTVCTSGSNVAPVINNPSGGTFSASPAGLVFISTTTGQINVSASTPGKYTIFFNGNGTCPITSSAVISIVATPDAQFSYSGPYCKDQADPLPTFPTGSSAGIFTASSAALVFTNTSTGEININASAAGTYTITNTIAASGACPVSVFTSTVTINPLVVVNAGPNQTVSTTTAQLAGSITNASGGTWSGGTGTFSDPNLLNAVYTRGPGETTATLTLTSADPPGPCGPQTDQVTIAFNVIPGAPVASGVTICSGNTATLSATAPGGAYRWFDAATGGTQLASGPSFTTPALTATTTYYVQTTVGDLTSTRTSVTVTVNPIPPTPVAPGLTICAGSPATLTASGSVGSYLWYDAPLNGTLLSTSNTYTTPALSANTSYYVEASNGGCTSPLTKVDVIVNPVPSITSPLNSSVCSGTAQNYTITADIPTATFSWSRAAVAGISNPAVINQVSSTITETLINTGGTPVNVTYVIVPTANGCPGTPLNYIVTVNPTPVVTSQPTAIVCNATATNYSITFNTPSTSFTWSRAAVPGISNAAVSGQRASTLREVLVNTTNAPIDVTYLFNYNAGTCSGAPFSLVVTVNPSVRITSLAAGPSVCSGTAQAYQITSNLSNATFSWSRAAVANISNPAVTNQTSALINETMINTSTKAVRVAYIITPSANGCDGAPFTYFVTINPQPPLPVANANSPICVGSTIQLRTPTIPKATYLWTGPNGYSSNSQNPDITNVTAANSGEYDLFVTLNGCTSNGSPAIVAVNAPPKADAGPDLSVCHNVTSVPLAGTVTGGTTTGIWSIVTGTGTISKSNDLLNAQYAPSAADKTAGSVTLRLTSAGKDDCFPSTDDMNIIFTTATISSKATDVICTGTAQNYKITSGTPNATFTWSRAAVTGISNGAVNGQTTNIIDETLFNTTTSPIDVVYNIIANDNGCPGTSFTYTLTVNPTPITPTATANTPVCVNSTIHLQTDAVPNATYSWTGPNGFVSPLQNTDLVGVTTANAGTYILTVFVNGCPSHTATVTVQVNEQSTAYAGPDQTLCATVTDIKLDGGIIGGSATGQWTTDGTGTFDNSKDPKTIYHPSAADKTAGKVTLTLATTSPDDCAIKTDQVVINFQPAPGADAGPDQAVCSQDVAVTLTGKIFISGGGSWTTSGTGTFSPASAPPNALYLPSQADIKNGSVILTLHAVAAGICDLSTDDMTVRFVPPPTVDAGGTRYVLHGKTITLNPTVSDNNVQYLWTPNTNMDDNTLKNPTITGVNDITYTLTVTDSRGCVSSDQTFIKVSPLIVIPNTFTPNGDGINDIWNIEGLIAYQQATVDIFDRYGQKVFHSIGYGKAWDGTYGGKQVPTGVYYYVIDPKFDGTTVLSGSLTIIR